MKLKKLEKNGKENQMSPYSSVCIDAEEQDNQKSILEEVENTPFNIYKRENDVLILMGNHVVKICNSAEEARKAIKEKEWEVILVAGSIFQTIVNEKKEKKKTKNDELLEDNTDNTNSDK